MHTWVVLVQLGVGMEGPCLARGGSRKGADAANSKLFPRQCSWAWVCGCRPLQLLSASPFLLLLHCRLCLALYLPRFPTPCLPTTISGFILLKHLELGLEFPLPGS